MIKHHRLYIVFSLVGILSGYVLLHPYAMLMYSLMHLHASNAIHAHWGEISLNAMKIFKPVMLPMAISFAFFGGLIGFLFAIILDKRNKWYTVKLESEKNRIALETLSQLMVTLAHYLLNANMIIGGKVRHCKKKTRKQEILSSLDVIEVQGRKIDAVIHSLRKITEIKQANYTTDGKVVMIDIEEEIAKYIKDLKGNEDHS